MYIRGSVYSNCHPTFNNVQQPFKCSLLSYTLHALHLRTNLTKIVPIHMPTHATVYYFIYSTYVSFKEFNILKDAEEKLLMLQLYSVKV